jgi:hypothetical protein
VRRSVQVTTMSIAALGADESSNSLPESFMPRRLTVSPLCGEIPGYTAHPPERTSNASQTSEKCYTIVSAYRGPDASKLVPAFNYFAA